MKILSFFCVLQVSAERGNLIAFLVFGSFPLMAHLIVFLRITTKRNFYYLKISYLLLSII